MIPFSTRATTSTQSVSEGTTRRWRFALVFSVLAAFCLVGNFSAGQDPVKDQDEPPLRLKKKTRPDQPPSPEKKKQAPPPKIDPEKKTSDAKEPAEPDAKELEEKIKELTSRIDRNMREADDRLAKKDTGDVTQQIERDIVKDLDDLLEQSQRQQQQQNQQQQSQSQSQYQKKQSQGGSSASARQEQRRRRAQSRAERRRHQSGQAQMPNPEQQDQQQTGGARGGNSPQGGMSKIADLYKDIWGHLPETRRQEMNQYSREQFMAKYNDLLKQYYSTIAEKGRQKKDGN